MNSTRQPLASRPRTSLEGLASPVGGLALWAAERGLDACLVMNWLQDKGLVSDLVVDIVDVADVDWWAVSDALAAQFDNNL